MRAAEPFLLNRDLLQALEFASLFVLKNVLRGFNRVVCRLSLYKTDDTVHWMAGKAV